MVEGTGSKSDGLGVFLGKVSIRQAVLSSSSAPTTSVSLCFGGAKRPPAASTVFGDRADGHRRSSSEHERAGVLQRAKQTEAFLLPGIFLYNQTAFLWQILERGVFFFF